MKVYVVIEYAVIEYEECYNTMGVYSSKEKARTAIEEYKEVAKEWKHRTEYSYHEFELDRSYYDVDEEDEDEDT